MIFPYIDHININKFIYLFFFFLQVPPSALEAFLTNIENGYQKYKNPYHNNVHAADVLQTVHYMLYQAGIMVSMIHHCCV